MEGVVAGRFDGRGPDTGVHTHPEFGDEAREQRAATFVHLQRHEPRRELHHMWFESEQLECVGCLEPEQAAPDNHRVGPCRRRMCGGTDFVEVVERAIDETIR